MNIGEMRFSVMLEKPVAPVADALGFIATADNSQWEDVAEVWAAIRPLTSNEIIRSRQVQLDTTHAITIYYFNGLTSAWRIRYPVSDTNGARFNIRSVKDPDMLRVEMQLECVVSTNG